MLGSSIVILSLTVLRQSCVFVDLLLPYILAEECSWMHHVELS